MKKRFKKIYIEITNICNLSCSFCAPNNRKKEYMNLDDFNYILSQIKEYTDYIYLHVKGEPLMHPNINEIIDLAHQNGLFVNITTNGTLIDMLYNKNIRQINYSMQSTKDIKKIRQTIRKMRNFIKDTNIYLSLRIWSEQSKKNISLKKMLLEEFESINSIDEIKDKKKLDINIFLSIEQEFKWPDIDSNIETTEGYCYGLKDHIAILVDGTVVPCCLDNNGDIALGNIYYDNIKDILESKKALKIIEGFQNRKIEESLCKKCNYKDRF
ncbi:MAG: radical SAM protein [Bacilli bacterium]|nr:radical SAM protein [Bacilli bacterium]MDD4282732.1 radical SAM protein [Bacilli bacterium]MDD4719003.1 radical SAM protein [Bacilli bacterium]